MKINGKTYAGWGERSNCWGTTLHASGIVKTLAYIDGIEMHDWLVNNCTQVDQPEPGDILAIADDELKHTALYIGDGLYFHQRGFRGQFRTDTLETVGYSGDRTHWRINALYRGKVRYCTCPRERFSHLHFTGLEA